MQNATIAEPGVIMFTEMPSGANLTESRFLSAHRPNSVVRCQASIIDRCPESVVRSTRMTPNTQPPPNRIDDDLEDASKFPNITEGLGCRSYSDEDVLEIPRGSWLRVFKTTWEA